MSAGEDRSQRFQVIMWKIPLPVFLYGAAQPLRSARPVTPAAIGHANLMERGPLVGGGNAVISAPSSVDFCQITPVAAGPILLKSAHLGAVDSPRFQQEYLYVCTMLTKPELAEISVGFMSKRQIKNNNNKIMGLHCYQSRQRLNTEANIPDCRKY